MLEIKSVSFSYVVGFFLTVTAFADIKMSYINPLRFSADGERLSCTDSWELSRIWEEEGLDFSAFKRKAAQNFDLVENSMCNDSDPIKIPHISHHVWFTDPHNPKEMGKQDRIYLEKKIKVLNQPGSKWRSILWLNIKEGIPETIALAHNLGIEVRLIDYLPSPFVDVIKSLLASKCFDIALATDLWRLQVVKDMGGFYSDNDYELYTNIDYLTRTFHSFFGFDDHSEINVGNSILAATKNHPVLIAYYDLVYRNLFGSNVPTYIQEPCCRFSKTIMTTGPTPLTLALAKAMNSEGFTDIVFPHGVIFSLEGSIPDDFKERFHQWRLKNQCPRKLDFIEEKTPVCEPILKTSGAIGNDQYSGTWIREGAYDPLPKSEKLLGQALGVDLGENLILQYKPYQFAKRIDFLDSLTNLRDVLRQDLLTANACKVKLAKMIGNDTINIAFTGVEYGPYKVGGLAAVVNTLTPALQQHFLKDNRFRAYFLVPYYSNGIHLPKKANPVCMFSHAFHYQTVYSKLLLTELTYRIEGKEVIVPTFLIEPDERLPHLFHIENPTAVYGNSEHSDLLNRHAYYGSALAALTRKTYAWEKSNFDIIHSHSFGGGWYTSLVPPEERPITIGHLHNLNWDQGQLAENYCFGTPCNFMRVIMERSDHIVTVSQSMIEDGVQPDLFKSFALNDLYSRLRDEEKISSVPNGFVASDFDPEKMLRHYNFELANGKVTDFKFKIKNEYLKNKGYISDPTKPLFVYISRFSREKGTDMLSTAAQTIKSLGGSLIVMGVKLNHEDEFITEIQQKYKNDPDVFVMKGNYLLEQANHENTGFLIRAAADFNLVPSHEEAFGLVPIEGFAMGALAITSRIGGMKDYVRQLDLNDLSYGNSFNYDESSFVKFGDQFLELSRLAMNAQIHKAFQYYRETTEEQRSEVSKRLMEEAKTYDFHAPNGAVKKLINLYKKLLKGKDSSL